VNLYDQWIAAKAAEAEAVETRRRIEDQLTAMLDLASDAEGTTTAKRDGYVIKATCRLTRKVDSDALQAIAAEHGLSEHLSSLFRWKPELSMKEWKAAAPNITGPLSGAITTTAGRPSYTITKEEGNNG
jgi:hypothetical protein